MSPLFQHNFSAGPSALPMEVMEEVQHEFLSYQNKGYHIGSISHRSNTFSEILDSVKDRLNRLLHLEDKFHCLFLQGGATTQFAQWVQNFGSADRQFGLLNTGVWSKKAWTYLQESVKDATMVYDGSKDAYRTTNFAIDDSNIDILHYTSNNTIYGTQFSSEPGKTSTLVCDASSDILSRPINMDRYGLIYAGAQKNIGPAGLTIVLINKSFLENYHNDKAIPSIWDYRSHLDKLFNTPASFPIYVMEKVLFWLENTIGGLEKMQILNHQKAEHLYSCIDADSFYKGYAKLDSRSSMNVVFNIDSPNQDKLESLFLKEAEENGFIGLKGHRALGGIRASIYNAITLDSVQALCSFMESFRRKYG